jgi:anti-anti-sigma factor
MKQFVMARQKHRYDMTSPSDRSRPGSSNIPQQRRWPENVCRVTLLRDDDQALLIVGGEIDIHTVQTLRDALRQATLLRGRILVDLDNVTFIGAAGFDALAATNRVCQSAAGRLQVVTTNRFTLRFLSLVELKHLAAEA